MEKVIARLNNIRHSPYKMRIVANAAKEMPVKKAQEYLDSSPKKAARYVLKALNSAVANAKHNNQLNEDQLTIAEIQVGDARRVRKPKYRARGRMDTIRSRYSHLRVVLSGPEVQPEPKKDEKKAQKESKKKGAKK